MVDVDDLLHDRIRTLSTYIQILEKVSKSFLGIGFNRAEQAVLVSLDRRIGWHVQFLAIIVGVGTFVIGLGVGRSIARSLPVLLVILTLAGALGLGAVIAIFRRARLRIARQEIRIAQLEIFRLEDRLHEQEG